MVEKQQKEDDRGEEKKKIQSRKQEQSHPPGNRQQSWYPPGVRNNGDNEGEQCSYHVLNIPGFGYGPQELQYPSPISRPNYPLPNIANFQLSNIPNYPPPSIPNYPPPTINNFPPPTVPTFPPSNGTINLPSNIPNVPNYPPPTAAAAAKDATSPAEKLSLGQSPSGNLLKVLSQCSVKTTEDADLALNVVGSLSRSLREYHQEKGQNEIVNLLLDTELKIGTVKALRAGMKMLASFTESSKPSH